MDGKNLTILISCVVAIGIIGSSLTLNANNTGISSGFLTKAFAQQSSSNYTLSANSIPNWIRNVTKWWSEGQTSDSEFLNAMQYLIDNGIIHASQTSSLSSITNQNSTMAQKINDLQIKYDTLQVKYNELLQQIQNAPANQLSNSNN